MRRNGRKEVTLTCFDGISADGGFVFDSCVLFPSLNKEWEKTYEIQCTILFKWNHGSIN